MHHRLLEDFLVEAAVMVPVEDGRIIVVARHRQGRPLVHDVGHRNQLITVKVHHQLLLAVQVRVPLVPVKGPFAPLGDLPQQYRDAGAPLSLDGRHAAVPVAPEQELVIAQCRGPDDRRIGAPLAHLLEVQVASVGQVDSLHRFKLLQLVSTTQRAVVPPLDSKPAVSSGCRAEAPCRRT
ncbi:hypothetical protein SDC9_189962 [bioreactor metagenome]|uniref:Uncharacterized protein n=1 Tax=bioreactor metagenome TaxID=1076179 RepID=A0A645HTL3_9ZZZZ